MSKTTAQARPRGPGRPSGARPGEARKALLVAARELMGEKGLPQVTAREVADRADLAPGLVRYYFGGKEGLLRAVIGQIAEEGRTRAAAWAAEEGDARARMRALIASMVEGFVADPYAPRLLFEQVLFADEEVVDDFVDHFGRSHLETLRSVLDEGQASGEFRVLDPEMAAASITGACVFMFLGSPVFDRVFGQDTFSPEVVERFTHFVSEMVLQGIVSRENDS